MPQGASAGVQYCTISEASAGQRLDNFLLKTLKGVPKSRIYRIIRSGEVRVNMQRAKPALNLRLGDVVRIPPLRLSMPAKPELSSSLATRLSSSILYEDAKFLVLNKPSGMAVHGGSGVNCGVIEALRILRPQDKFLELAHRLDKETSGCLVIARKRSALRALNAALAAREVQKVYLALASTAWSGRKVKQVTAPLLKNILRSGERMVSVTEHGKDAETRIELLENYPQACLIKATPKTGRTHQIRVHCAHIGHPLIGDKKYGLTGLDNLQSITMRLCLHASAIQFTLDGKKYAFEAPTDANFENIRSILRDETPV